ncbi:MAG: S8 family serine peptidase [Candidatus Aminicenantes bacterium]|nr:S8 family serine peptidase [Candidatus Aminicenantes bacterium]
MQVKKILKNRKALLTLTVLFFGLFFVLVSWAEGPSGKVKSGGKPALIAGKGNQQEFAQGEALVKLKKGVNFKRAGDIAASVSAQVKRYYRTISAIKGHVYVHLKSKSSSTTDMVTQLRKNKDVEFVAPNYRVYIAQSTPNDTRFNELWGLHNTGQTGGAADVDIDAPEAWLKGADSSAVITAVMDTGVDYNHPDLNANMWVNPGEIAGNSIDDDGNGYIDDVHGIDAISGSGNPMDDNGHGTHCAGTIGAVGNNNRGVTGVGWNAGIIGAKFLDASGSGFNADALACIDYFVDLKTNRGQEIVAINASYGGGAFDQSIKDAIDAAGSAGILFCAAAGSSDNDIDITPFYPASYTCANIISVTAVDHNGGQFYNYGASGVDLAAPGIDILSTVSRYNPQPGDIFFDDMESGSGNWTTGGVNNTWAITTDQEGFANPDFPLPSPPNSWSDSPGANYASNTDAYLMNSSDLDLSVYAGQEVYLGFSTAIFVEDSFDHAYVEVSGNSGSAWVSIVDFSGRGFYWQTGYYYLVPEAVKTSAFRFRFRLTSDLNINNWGWLLDDIGVGADIDYGYETQSGTSMAAPYVTGAAALAAVTCNLNTAAAIKAGILDNVVPLPALDGLCVTGGLLNLDNALCQPQPLIVTFPVAGQVYTSGGLLPVWWTTWGMSGNVKIKLVRVDKTAAYLITGAVLHDSSPFYYTIPCSVLPGSYFVRVNQVGTASGISGNFTINTGPCIRVFSPTGSDAFAHGDQVTITWDSAGITGDVKIKMVRVDKTASYLVSGGTPYNNSPFYYTIPGPVTAGSYFFRVSKPGITYGKSGDFYIKPGVSSITVLSPIGGSVFAVGGQIAVDWLTDGINGDVAITLKSAGGGVDYQVTPAAAYNSAPYIYTIPCGVEFAGYYVEVRQGAVYGVSGNVNVNSGTCINVTSPSAGQVYSSGSQLPIEWACSGITGDVTVKLVRTDKTAGYLVTGAVPYNGSPVNYTIPAAVTPGSYFIRVNKSGVMNGNSGNFTIN